MVSRIAARNKSGLLATPSPITISEGLKKFTTLASIDPTLRPAAWSMDTATGSPNDAARAPMEESAPSISYWSEFRVRRTMLRGRWVSA